jgi:uncharacterized protein (TIGR03086 family)
MTHTTDPVALLERIYQHADSILSQISPDQYELPTPCTQWNVRDVVDHVTGSIYFMASAVTEDVPQAAPPADVAATEQPAERFRAAADLSLSVWRSPGALEGSVRLGPVEMPAQALLGLNQFEVLTHAWDVAEGIGVDRSMDPAVAEAALAAAHMIVSDETRGDRFAPSVEIADDAPAHDRLAAFLGRRPA